MMVLAERNQDQESEKLLAPYDESTYEVVLEQIQPDDVILDIGAGDLQLALCLAEKAHHVYAWEAQAETISNCCANLPSNLVVCCAQEQFELIPDGVTTAILLMNQCQHFRAYVKKLRSAGCKRLITNARWGMNIEVIDLQESRWLYTAAPAGWFACWCGHTGFKADSAQQLTWEMETAVNEVIFCPNCRYNEL